MEYTEEMQISTDLDWYAVDKDGLIIHFASGGGRLPSSVAKKKEETDFLAKYFRSLPVQNIDFNLNSKLDAFVKFDKEEQKEQYLSDFISMSKRGFFSFDKTAPGNFDIIDYHLVSVPNQARIITEFPSDVIEILTCTKVNKSVEDIITLSITDFSS